MQILQMVPQFSPVVHLRYAFSLQGSLQMPYKRIFRMQHVLHIMDVISQYLAMASIPSVYGDLPRLTFKLGDISGNTSRLFCCNSILLCHGRCQNSVTKDLKEIGTPSCIITGLQLKINALVGWQEWVYEWEWDGVNGEASTGERLRAGLGP